MKNRLLFLLIQAALLFGCRTAPGPQVQEAPASAGVAAPAEAFFSNPIEEGADPWVFRKDDFYYTCGSGRGGIWVAKSEKLTQLGERVVVWQPGANSWNSHNIWAPELHFFGGKWYIYYAASKTRGGPFINQRSGVLESATGDPFGPYTDKGKIYTGDHWPDTATVKWAIDLSPFRLNGQLYAMWSGWEENAATDKTKQHLYLAPMSNPWTISGNRVLLASPQEPWETGGELDLIEGPELLKKNEKAFIIYSTRESWLKDYRLGQLTLSDTLLNPLLPQNWKKSGPVFQGTDQVYGVGHCSFTTSPDHTEDWILYHTKKSTAPGWQRDIRLQPFTWTADGFPEFGTPIPAGVPLRVPSGE